MKLPIEKDGHYEYSENPTLQSFADRVSPLIRAYMARRGVTVPTVPVYTASFYSAGTGGQTRVDGRAVMITQRQSDDKVDVMATIAHEFIHAKMIKEGSFSPFDGHGTGFQAYAEKIGLRPHYSCVPYPFMCGGTAPGPQFTAWAKHAMKNDSLRNAVAPLSHVDATLAMATRDIAPAYTAWNVVAADLVPNTYEGVRDYLCRHGRVAVSDEIDGTSIWGRGDIAAAFAAWHDTCHVRMDAPFNLAGERRVHQCMVRRLYQWRRESKRPVCQIAFERAEYTLYVWNVARLEYWDVYKTPPHNPRSFTEGYLIARSMLEPRDPCGGPC